MVGQLHKYRCETCASLEISGLDDSCPNEEICGKTGCTISPIVKSWIEIYGCASHSDAIKAEQRIKDVLGELRKFFVANNLDGCPLGEMNSKRCLSYDRCELCIFDRAIKTSALLRGKEE